MGNHHGIGENLVLRLTSGKLRATIDMEGLLSLADLTPNIVQEACLFIQKPSFVCYRHGW